MPVATIFGMVVGHDHEVPDTREDVVVAARAQIRLARLIRLHTLHRDWLGIERGITLGRIHGMHATGVT
jgi:hypothetical protein